MTGTPASVVGVEIAGDDDILEPGQLLQQREGVDILARCAVNTDNDELVTGGDEAGFNGGKEFVVERQRLGTDQIGIPDDSSSNWIIALLVRPDAPWAVRRNGILASVESRFLKASDAGSIVQSELTVEIGCGFMIAVKIDAKTGGIGCVSHRGGDDGQAQFRAGDGGRNRNQRGELLQQQGYQSECS